MVSAVSPLSGSRGVMGGLYPGGKCSSWDTYGTNDPPQDETGGQGGNLNQKDGYDGQD